MAGSETLVYKVIVDTKDSMKNIGGMKRGFADLGKGASAAFGGMLAAINPVVLAVAAATLGVASLVKGVNASVKAYAEYEQKMANVSTLVDTSIVDMEKLKEQIMALPPELGKAADLTDALYQAMSGGVEAGKAVQFVADSARAAKAGMTDALTAVDAGTTIMNSFGLAAGDATKIYDQMFVAVKAGKTTFGELASSIGKVAPLASEAGLSTEQLLSAIATLTTTGQKTSESVTSLKAALSNIIKPGKAAWEEAQAMGLEWDAAALKAKGLTKFMDDLAKATDGDTGKMAKLFGSTEALNSMLFLTGKGAEKFTEINEAMGNSAGETGVAFGKMDSTLQSSFDKMGNSFNKLGITIGEILAPAVKAVVDSITWLVEGLTDVINIGVKFTGWIIDAVKWIDAIKVSFGPFHLSLLDILNPISRVISIIQMMVDTFKLLVQWAGKGIDAIKNTGISEKMTDMFSTLTEPFKNVDLLLTQVVESLKKMISWLKKKLSFGLSEEETAKEIEKIQKSILSDRKLEIKDLERIVHLVESYAEAQKAAGKAAKENTEGILKSRKAAKKAKAEVLKDLQDALAAENFVIDIDVDLGNIDVGDSLEQIQLLYFILEKHPEFKVMFVGEGSTVKPLSEKIKEMKGLVDGFDSNIESKTPAIKVAFTDMAGDSLTTAMSVMESSFNSMFDSVIDGTLNVQSAFKDMAISVLETIAKMLASQAIASFVSLLGGTVMGMFTGGGGTSPHIGAGGTTAVGMAVGGPVKENRPYMIGEKGPELFVPDQAGKIIPNDKMKGGGGSINVVNNISVESSGNKEQDDSMARGIARAIDEKIKMQIAAQMRPGGVLNPTSKVAMGAR